MSVTSEATAGVIPDGGIGAGVGIVAVVIVVIAIVLAVVRR